MAIDANVAYVELHEDGSGVLHLCDRVPNGSRGQSRLRFDSAPYEVTALNGLPIWGGDAQIMLCDTEIAKRDGYTRISFNERDVFLAAVAEYHARRREEPPSRKVKFITAAEIHQLGMAAAKKEEPQR